MCDNLEEIGRRIRARRKELDLTQDELGSRLYLNKSTIQRYEVGKFKKIKIPTIQAFAKELNVDPNWLALKTDDPGTYPFRENDKIIGVIPAPKMKKVPLLGNIACGEPILAEENIETFVNMPESTNGSFALRCKGDSMINARIFDGDIVFIREQPEVENGEIAAVLIDNEATLKRVYLYDNRIELRAENPTFPSLSYEGDQLNQIRIIGKAIGFFSTII